METQCHLEIRVFSSSWKRWHFEEFWHFAVHTQTSTTSFGVTSLKHNAAVSRWWPWYWQQSCPAVVILLRRFILWMLLDCYLMTLAIQAAMIKWTDIKLCLSSIDGDGWTMAHWKTISEHEHRSERLNRLCKMKKFTDNFLCSHNLRKISPFMWISHYVICRTVRLR